LAKLVVWAPNRELARLKMKAALREVNLDGVKTVIPMHLAVMDEPDFIARDITIQYLEEHPGLMG
jgi:biotin carboxylase